MTNMEKFKDSDIWKSGDTFTVTEVVQTLGIPKSAVQDILSSLQDQIAKSEGAQRRVIYRRVSSSQHWIRKAWRKHTDQQLGIVA